MTVTEAQHLTAAQWRVIRAEIERAMNAASPRRQAVLITFNRDGTPRLNAYSESLYVPRVQSNGDYDR